VTWGLTLCLVAGSLAVAFVQPWRFFHARRRCPQCQGPLPRWSLWGWREDWACARCGCLINR
jgi:hypothetical protein